MNSMHRQFGKLMSKGPGNSAPVATLLMEYDNADQMLSKIIEASKAWRDSWVTILSLQANISSSFDSLYNPIYGASEGHTQEMAETPRDLLERSSRLKETYGELKAEMLDEVNGIDARIVRPAMDAKDHIQPLKKTIKKYENKRLDMERFQDRVTNTLKKQKRSDRDNMALAKAEQDLARATDVITYYPKKLSGDFNAADEHLRETFPPLIAAAFSILPHLLAAQIMIQNTLLAQYYTVLHTYCGETGFPSPPPPMDDVISVWRRDVSHPQQQIESLTLLSASLRRPSNSHSHRSISPNPAGRRLLRMPSHQEERPPAITAPRPTISPTPSRSPSPSPPIPIATRPSQPDYSSHLSPASASTDAYIHAHSPAAPKADYFTRSTSASHPSPLSTSPGAVKKKPPPPPPKRKPSTNFNYVTALYDFGGQSEGDLSFREGDRIKVVKKTESTDDWWEGELAGRKGAFPANYCK